MFQYIFLCQRQLTFVFSKMNYVDLVEKELKAYGMRDRNCFTRQKINDVPASLEQVISIHVLKITYETASPSVRCLNNFIRSGKVLCN